MIIWALFSTLIAGLMALLAFVLYMRRGQFDDVEDAKYQMFRDEEE